jgi:hypothetical protein
VTQPKEIEEFVNRLMRVPDHGALYVKVATEIFRVKDSYRWVGKNSVRNIRCWQEIALVASQVLRKER